MHGGPPRATTGTYCRLSVGSASGALRRTGRFSCPLSLWPNSTAGFPGPTAPLRIVRANWGELRVRRLARALSHLTIAQPDDETLTIYRLRLQSVASGHPTYRSSPTKIVDSSASGRRCPMERESNRHDQLGSLRPCKRRRRVLVVSERHSDAGQSGTDRHDRRRLIRPTIGSDGDPFAHPGSLVGSAGHSNNTIWDDVTMCVLGSPDGPRIPSSSGYIGGESAYRRGSVPGEPGDGHPSKRSTLEH